MQGSDRIAECGCTRRFAPRHILKNKLRVLATAIAGDKGLRRRMIGLLLVFVIGTCGLTALIWERRSEALSSSGKALAALSQLTEEQTTRTIENVDQTLEIAEEKLASARRDSTSGVQDIRRELQGLLKN